MSTGDYIAIGLGILILAGIWVVSRPVPNQKIEARVLRSQNNAQASFTYARGRPAEGSLLAARTICDKPLKYGQVVKPHLDTKPFPFHNAPVEILVLIFQECLLISPTKRGCLVPKVIFCLSAVCRRWRQIVHHTPALWSSLNIRCESQAKCNIGSTFLDKVLERSTGHALTLSIRGRRSNADQGHDGSHPAELLGFWKTIANEFERWESVDIEVENHTHPILSHINPSLKNSRLKSLSFETHHLRTEFPCLFSETIKCISSLRRLRWRTPPVGVSQLLREANWPVLSFVHISSWQLSTQDCFDILLAAPLLETCFVDRVSLQNMPAATSPRKSNALIHCSLVQLKIGTDTSLSPFFDSITLPSLRELTLQSPSRSTMSVIVMQGVGDQALLGSEFKTFLQRSSPSLSTFVIENISMKETDLIASLDVISHSLRHFEVHEEFDVFRVRQAVLTDKIILALSETISTDTYKRPRLLPKLAILKLTGSLFCTDGIFSKMVVSRYLDAGHLERVQVEFCGNRHSIDAKVLKDIRKCGLKVTCLTRVLETQGQV